MRTAVHTFVRGRPTTGQRATFFRAHLDERVMTPTNTRAGHGFPIAFRADGSRILLEAEHDVVGMMAARGPA